MDTAPDSFGRWLRTRRLERGLSISAAAKAAGINRATWTTWEENEYRPQPHNYSAIERVLQWRPGTVEDLVRGVHPGAINAVQEDMLGLVRDTLPADLIELIELHQRHDLTKDERAALMSSVRVTVAGILGMIDQRKAAERQSRRAG